MSRRRIVIPLVLAAILISAGCASPYISAEGEYFKGDPAAAEQILTPSAEEAVKKNSREKNLMIWDLGVYRFAQGNYDGAIEAFMEGVRDVEELHSTGQTVAAALTSASSQKYIGDPVEISMAYLYIGLSYFMKEDYQNALVGFRRSLEEDLSKDEARQGDMGITNFMMGETFLRVGKYDDAAVAFRRAIEQHDDFAPAYMGLSFALDKMGSTSDLARIKSKLDTLIYDDNIKKNWSEYPDQGITVVMFSGKASKVQKDAFTGSFRKRSENQHNAKKWLLNVLPEPGRANLYFSDAMHEHFTDQGGLGDEVRQQTTRAVIGTGMKALFGFGINTDADIRYWPTLPGYIYVGYVPVPAGNYSIEVEGLGNSNKLIEAFSREYDGIEVVDGKRTLVVITSFGTVSMSAR
ncbi:MAG: tetratricopeptide repeat protein [Methanosarcinaceae archaeon]|nr:tetratricopeptide repeat protein [Methanosarcinaceae archaeon]